MFFEHSKFGSRSATNQNGFTLVEMLTVMVVLVAVASITLETTEEIAFEGRYEVTKDRYAKIRKAIVGDVNQIVNGQPNIEGFVKDVGRLPRNLHELLVKEYCSNDYRISQNTPASLRPVTYASNKLWCEGKTPAGTWIPQEASWKGPYLSTSQPDYNGSALADGWGNAAENNFLDQNYGWNVVYFDASGSVTTTLTDAKSMKIQSLGKDQCLYDPLTCLDDAASIYDDEFPAESVQPVIRHEDWTIDINGILPHIRAIPSATDICLRILRNAIRFSSSPSHAPVDSSSSPPILAVPFAFVSGYVPMGSAIGLIYQSSDCAAELTSSTVPHSAINQTMICVNTENHANFTNANCLANKGLWIDDGTEQYCDLVSGTNCTGTTGTQLGGGVAFPRFQLMLIPHTTLPTIYW